MDKKLLIYVLLLICLFLMCSALSVITPFFPPFAIKKGISEEIVGFIIGANPIGAFFASLALGKILNDNNRFFYMILGLIMQSTGMYIFGTTYFIHDNSLLIVVSVLARIMSGMGAACFITPFYAYVPILYPNKIEKMIGICELAAGIGFLIGPVSGSLLYSLGGYLTPFAVFGTISLVITPIIYHYIKTVNKTEVSDLSILQSVGQSFIPRIIQNATQEALLNQTPIKNKNHTQEKSDYQLMEEGEGESQNQLLSQSITSPINPNNRSVENDKNFRTSQPTSTANNRFSYLSHSDKMKNRTSLENIKLSRYSHDAGNMKIGYFQVLSDYSIFMTFMLNVVINFVIMYFAPTLAQFLENSYFATPDNVGYLMSVNALTYTMSSFGVTFVRNYKTLYLLFGTVLIATGFLFMGPDEKFTGINHNLYVVLAAQGVIGVGVAITFILSLPTLNDQILEKYPNLQLQSANIASALFNSSMSLGELLGPIVAGIMTKQFGFARGCSYTGFAIFTFAILYMPVVLRRKRLYY